MANMSMQTVTVTPKFIFGVNGQLNNCLQMHEEKKLVYVAGHNIIVYDIEDGIQTFIPGSANADAINFYCMSPSQRFIAICERATPRAQVTIYEVVSKKKRKTLPEPEMENLSFNCKEFLSCAFTPETEKQHLITLSGEDDWCIIIWQWDQLKMLARMDLNLVNPPTEMETFSMSSKKMGQDTVLVVTGSNCFKFYKLEEMMRSIVPVYENITAAGGDGSFSEEFTCHEWSMDPIQLVLATAEGKIVVLNMKGEFQVCVDDSPNRRIDCVRAYGRGLIFAGTDGMIYPYEATGTDQLYRPQ